MIKSYDNMMDTLNSRMGDDGVLIVEFDHRDRPVNTFTPHALAQLSDVIAQVERQEIKPVGVIFRSAKVDAFIAGADLFAMRDMDEADVEAFLELGQSVFERIAKLSIPTVAAINGLTLGGGMELALACDYRIAADRGSINLGLPEIKLGIIPGWGGTVRLPRLIGLRRALPMLLGGKIVSPRKAKSLGVVDEVVRPESLHAAAHRMVRKRPTRQQPGFVDRFLASNPMLLKWVCKAARKQAAAMTLGNYPASDKLIDTIEISLRKGVEAGLRAERESVLILSRTHASRNLMRLFFLKQESKRAVKEKIHAQPKPVAHAAVVGGGAMGAGIVHALVRAQVPVRLVDLNEQAISAALGRIRKLLDGDVKSKRLSKLEANCAMRRVSPTTSLTGLSLADIVIEAVAEKIEVKKELFAQLESAVRHDCVLASNTSSLSITEIASDLQHPDRVIGLHFFNPVAKMPLVEVIRAPKSGDEALATGAALAQCMGKVPIVVGDGAGFVVNRVLIPYLGEALVMASQGADIVQVDSALKHWGMPMGPFELLDQIGMDVVMHIFDSVSSRLGDPPSAPQGVRTMIERNWLGKKTGRGFYVYEKTRRRRKPQVNHKLSAIWRPAHSTAAPITLDEQIVIDRLVSPMINEATRLLNENVIDSAALLDLASVLGLGLAPFRGGLAHHAQTIGLGAVVRTLDELADKHGDRFAPTPALRQVAEHDGSMQELVPDVSPQAKNITTHVKQSTLAH